MTVTNRLTGKDLYVGFIGSGGTANLSGDQRAFEVTAEQETADVTAGADGARAVKPTVQNFGASLEVLFTGTAGSAAMAIATLGAEGTLTYGPQGSASGKPKGAFPAIITKRDITMNFDDAVVVKFEFAGQGDETSDPTTATW